MENYITPQLLFRKTFSEIENYRGNCTSFFDSETENEVQLPYPIESILENNKYLCILGEPGCGKTRFLEEQVPKLKKNGHNVIKYVLRNANLNKIESEIEKLSRDRNYILLDALDEIEEVYFFSALNTISKLSLNYPNIHIWFTCREYYIKGNEGLFKMIPLFSYLKILPFEDKEIDEYIKAAVLDKNVQIAILNSVHSKHYLQLKRIIQVPRYLNAFCEYITEKGVLNISFIKRSELFEYIIYKGIEAEKKIAEMNMIFR